MADQIEELQGYVNDMLAVEIELHSVFRRQKEDGQIRRYAAAHQLVARTEDVIDRHMASLKDCLRRLGGSESLLKKAGGGVIGVVAGIFDKVRTDDAASPALRDDYAALCFASICYEMLHTTALAMKDQRTADLAIQHLKDFPPLIMALSEILPQVLIDELAAGEKISPDASVVKDAVRNTRAAWAEASA